MPCQLLSQLKVFLFVPNYPSPGGEPPDYEKGASLRRASSPTPKEGFGVLFDGVRTKFSVEVVDVDVVVDVDDACRGAVDVDDGFGTVSDMLKIREQTVKPALASYAALLVTAEWRSRIEFVIGICPDDSGAQLVGDFENLRTLVGPYSSAQTIRDVIGFLHCLLGRTESLDGKYRTEDLFLHDPRRL